MSQLTAQYGLGVGVELVGGVVVGGVMGNWN